MGKETRREAINRVQERLGPATPRPVAERTFWTLGRQGKITLGDDGYLIEAEISDADLRDTAIKDINAQQTAQHRHAGHMRNFTVTINHFKKARVAWAWQSINNFLAPTLLAAEGFDAQQHSGDDAE